MGLDEQAFAWRTLFGSTARAKQANSFLAANIRAIATAFCNGEVRLRNAQGEEIPYERKGKNPLLDLLYKPSPFLTETQFKQVLASQFLVYGDVFVLKTGRNTRGLPTILLPIPGPSVEILKDKGGYPNGYRIQTTTGVYSVGLEDMLHIYEPGTADLFKGRSRTKLCKMDAETIQAAKTFNLAFFENGATIGGLISFPEGVQVKEKDKAEMLAYFNDSFQGARKAHRTALLANGGKYESYKTSHKDMEYAEGQKFSMQQIYAAMGVPPALVGLFEYAPQFNTKEQQKIFYETTVIPMAKLFSDAINENLVGDFYKDETVYFEYDFSKVKALEKDWAALASAASQLANLWPVNEVKKALDLPFSDIPGGDDPPDPILSAFGTFAAQNPAAALMLAGGAKNASQKTKRIRYVRPTPAQMKRHKADKLRLLEEQGQIMRASIESHFNGQAEQVKSWMDANPNTLFSYKAALGCQKEQQNALLAVKIPALSEIFNAATQFEQEYLQSLIPSKDFKFLSHKDRQDRVAYWAQTYASKWADSIERTTFERLDKIIKTGLLQEMSTAQINKWVLQFFSEEGYEPADAAPDQAGRRVSIFDRVQTIVQTETRATISEAQLEAFKSTPFVSGKGWITTMGVSDHHEGHAEMDGQEVKAGENFINPATGQKTQAPGQFGAKDQDINCLCDIYPIVRDEE